MCDSKLACSNSQVNADENSQSLEELIRAGDVVGISRWLRDHHALSLDLEGWGLDLVGPVVAALEHTSVIELSLADNQIQDFDAVFANLTKAASVQSLWFDATGMTDSDLTRFSHFLPQYKGLTHLYLRSNPISDVGVRALFEAIATAKAPNTLCLIDVSHSERVSAQISKELSDKLI